MIDCSCIQEKIVDELASELSSAESAELHRHLEQCPACAAEYRELQRICNAAQAAFQSGAPEKKLSDARKEHILRAEFPRRTLSFRSGGESKRFLLQIAALLVFCGVLGYVLIPALFPKKSADTTAFIPETAADFNQFKPKPECMKGMLNQSDKKATWKDIDNSAVLACGVDRFDASDMAEEKKSEKCRLREKAPAEKNASAIQRENHQMTHDVSRISGIAPKHNMVASKSVLKEDNRAEEKSFVAMDNMMCDTAVSVPSVREEKRSKELLLRAPAGRKSIEQLLQLDFNIWSLPGAPRRRMVSLRIHRLPPLTDRLDFLLRYDRKTLAVGSFAANTEKTLVLACPPDNARGVDPAYELLVRRIAADGTKHEQVYPCRGTGIKDFASAPAEVRLAAVPLLEKHQWLTGAMLESLIKEFPGRKDLLEIAARLRRKAEKSDVSNR